MRLSVNFSEEVDWRLLRHMNIILVDNFSTEDLQVMATTMIERHFTTQGFVNTVTRLATVNGRIHFSIIFNNNYR